MFFGGTQCTQLTKAEEWGCSVVTCTVRHWQHSQDFDFHTNWCLSAFGHVQQRTRMIVTSVPFVQSRRLVETSWTWVNSSPLQPTVQVRSRSHPPVIRPACTALETRWRSADDRKFCNVNSRQDDQQPFVNRYDNDIYFTRCTITYENNKKYIMWWYKLTT